MQGFQKLDLSTMDLDKVLREFLQMYSGDKRIKYEKETL